MCTHTNQTGSNRHTNTYTHWCAHTHTHTHTHIHSVQCAQGVCYLSGTRLAQSPPCPTHRHTVYNVQPKMCCLQGACLTQHPPSPPPPPPPPLPPPPTQYTIWNTSATCRARAWHTASTLPQASGMSMADTQDNSWLNSVSRRVNSPSKPISSIWPGLNSPCPPSIWNKSEATSVKHNPSATSGLGLTHPAHPPSETGQRPQVLNTTHQQHLAWAQLTLPTLHLKQVTVCKASNTTC